MTMNNGLLFGIFGLICFSAFFNFILLSSWYPNITSKTTHSISDYQRLRFLSKEIKMMKNEQSRFREEITGLVHALEEKINEGADQKGVLKVHLWDDTTLPNGYREKKLYSLEGFSTHPRTTLVDSPEDADIIAWVSVRGNTEKEVPPENYSNVILLDYAGMYFNVEFDCCYSIIAIQPSNVLMFIIRWVYNSSKGKHSEAYGWLFQEKLCYTGQRLCICTELYVR